MESLLLDKIDQPSDLKKLNAQQVEKLCAEIRHFMLENISKTGGHLASNLGTVELTVALHRVLETPKDKIVFDVGISATPTNCLPDAGNSLTICGSWMAFPAFQILTKVCTMPLLPDTAIRRFHSLLVWLGPKRSSMSPGLWWR